MKLNIAIIPNEGYLTKNLILSLVSGKYDFNWYLIDVDRPDLGTDFKLSIEELTLFKRVVINSDFDNKKFREKKKWLLSKVKIIQPDLIISFTSLNFSYRCLRYNFPKLKMFVVQTAFLSGKNTFKPIGYRIRNKIRNFILNAPVYSFSNVFFEYHKYTMFGAWSKKYIPEVKQSNLIFCEIGNYELDQFLKPRRDLGVLEVKEKMSMTYFTQPLVHYFGKNANQKVQDLISSVLEAYPDINLLIKLHPRDKEANYTGLIESNLDRVTWADRGENVMTILEKTDVFITHYSTTMDAAVAMNIPVLIIDPEENFAKLIPEKRFFIRIISKVEDVDLTDLYFTNAQSRLNERNTYLLKVAGNIKGDSAERILDSMFDFLNATIN